MINLGSAVGYLLLDTTSFKDGIKGALSQLDVFKREGATVQDKLSGLGSAFTSAGKTLTKNFTLPLAGLGTLAVNTTASFEAAMSQVSATMGLTKDSTAELNGELVNTQEALEALAKKLGAETKFSATEAAEAINNMAMAGYNVQETYDTLPQVLSLASAGCLDLDYATQLVANGLNVMGLSTKDATEFADKLAVTAANAYGSVSDFGEGILIAGAQAKLANVNLTDTYTALGILGDNGISASEGGTYLRNTLKNLYTPTEDASKALAELGVQTANSDGTLRDFQTVLQELGQSLDGLTEDQRIKAMSRIFDTRTISAANALIENSTERWDELSATIDAAGGAASQMADTQLNNLNGQITILKSALEGAAIAFGELLLPIVKDVTAFVQKLVDWVNNLTEGQKKTIVTILEIVAAAGPLLLILGKVVNFILKIINIVPKVIELFKLLGAVMAANPIGLIVTAIAALVAAFIYLWNNCEEFRQFWIDLWEGVQDVFNAVVDWFDQAIQDVISFFKNLPTKIGQFLDEVVNWFATLPERIAYWLGFAAGKIVQWTTDIWNHLVETIPQIISDIGTWFSELPGRIWEWLVEAFNRIVQWAVDIYNKAKEAITNFLKAIVEGLKKLPGKFKEWFTSAINYLKTLPKALFQIGADIFNGLWDGLKSIWQKISAWIDGVVQKIKSIFSAAKSGYNDATSGVGGSYASGLDYVPRDMTVQVHQGERILTKQENQRYGESNGDTFNFYSPEAIDPVTAAREFKRVKIELAEGLV